MKKTFAVFVLAAFTAVASAGPMAFVTYDYDSANGNVALKSQQETQVGLAVNTQLGTFDGSVVERQLLTGVRDNGLGFEVGYTNGIKLGRVDLKGRAAYGRVNQLNTRGGGFTGNSQYYSLGAEASLPVTNTITGFVGYRFRDGLNAATPAVQNRFTIGADFAINENIALRAGYAFTKQAGQTFNGLTAAVAYTF